MLMIAVKYAKTDKRNGNMIYRRRVPTALGEYFPGQTMLVKALGTGDKALAEYTRYHAHIEHLKALAENGVDGLSPNEQRTRLKALLESWGADPHSSGYDEGDLNEWTWRQEAANKLLDPYQDSDTGEWRDVPADTEAQALALMEGVPDKTSEPMITDAFKFYLEENAKTIPEQRKKQIQRFRRAEKHLATAIGSDKPVSNLTREDARKWRDMRLAAGVAPDTVRREKNDISAVIGLAQSELDAGGKNPFSGLKLPKAKVSRQSQREALPLEVIEGVYGLLKAKRPDLLPIWTLLDFTGARPSEISQLLVEEIILDHAVPHIIIHERDDRTLKTSWSTRKVPLVGEALIVPMCRHGRALSMWPLSSTRSLTASSAGGPRSLQKRTLSLMHWNKPCMIDGPIRGTAWFTTPIAVGNIVHLLHRTSGRSRDRAIGWQRGGLV
jgi:hypothetical protein